VSGEVVLNGVVQGLLLLAALLAWPVTWLLLRRYRRQVVRAMQRTSVDQARRAQPSAVPTPTGDGSATAADPSVPSAAVGVDATAGGARESLASIRNRVATRRIVLWRRYAAAGASQAGVLTVATFLAADIEFLPVRTLLVWVVYAWPVVLTVAILSGFDRMVVATTTGLYVAVVVGLGVLGGDVDGALALWALMGLLATVVVVPYLHRSVRAVGVVVLAFVFIGLVGAELVLAFVGASSGRISAVVTVTSWLGVGGGAFVLLIVLGFAVAGVAGWFALGRFGRAYRHNGLPDQLVLVGAVWALFAAAHGFPLAFEGAWWAGAGLVGFAAFWLVAARPLDGDAEPSGPRLLMLRVFALGRNSEQLFRQVATDWQYVGPMRLIAGPDLARATVEPDEFLTFAAGRLEDLFISVLSQLEARRHEGVRDRHGRYRVQEYLCFDDTWRPVVRHLIQDTDLVLMDLRGFVQGNDGARHELTLLASTGMLASTTLVVDKATDLAQVESAVIEGVGNFSDATLVTLQDRRRLRLVDMVPDRWREGS
jgi:hypothetical protein